MKESILQFGTGNFLRGFADCFIDKMNKEGLYNGKIIIASPTNSRSVDKINRQNGVYNLILRGVENGCKVNERYEIHSVSRAINPYADFASFIALAKSPDLRFIISNTTEAGIKFDPACKFGDEPPASFPAKLARLMYERYSEKMPGFVVLACELIDDNGKELEKCVLEYAKLWGLEPEFTEWIKSQNQFCSTLVDRIVTGYPNAEAEQIFAEIGTRDELLNTAEPYHLWVIEGDFEAELPLQSAGLNVVWAKDVSPYKKMKVRILNGSHTSLVFPSLLCGVETVRESLEDELLGKFLNCCLFDYILPTVSENENAPEFANAVLERFANPYIRHMWKSIALNSVSKYSARVLPTVLDYYNAEKPLPLPLVFSLACLIEYYKSGEPSDNAQAVQYIKEHDIKDILSNKDLWGTDLNFLEETVCKSTEKIHTLGAAEAIKWSML